MGEAVHEYKLEDAFKAAIYGPSHENFITARLIPSALMGAKKDEVCFVKAASDKSCPGFKEVVETTFGKFNSSEPDVYGDAAIINKPGQAVVMRTGDCLDAIFFEAKTKKLAMAHCGRYAMEPVNQIGENLDNIITRTYSALVRGVIRPEVHAYLTGSICKECFEHSGPGSDKFIKPFRQSFLENFIKPENGSLDLVGMATMQLQVLGVKKKHIVHDGLCTKEDERLASYRRNAGTSKETERNAIVAVLL